MKLAPRSKKWAVAELLVLKLGIYDGGCDLQAFELIEMHKVLATDENSTSKI